MSIKVRKVQYSGTCLHLAHGGRYVQCAFRYPYSESRGYIHRVRLGAATSVLSVAVGCLRARYPGLGCLLSPRRFVFRVGVRSGGTPRQNSDTPHRQRSALLRWARRGHCRRHDGSKYRHHRVRPDLPDCRCIHWHLAPQNQDFNLIFWELHLALRGRLTCSDSELTVVHSGCSVESKQSVNLVAAECWVMQIKEGDHWTGIART